MASNLLRKIYGNSNDIANVSSYIIARLVAIGAYAVSVPIFVNRTSDAQYGVIAIGFSLLGLSMLLDLAIGYVITQSTGKRYARTGTTNQKIFNRLFWLYFVISSALTLLLLVIIAFLNLKFEDKLFFGSLCLVLPALSISGAVTAVFQAHNSLVYLNFSRLIFELGKAFGIVLGAICFESYLAVGPLLFFFATLRAGLDIYQLSKKLRYRIHPPSVRLIRRSLPLLPIGLPSMGSVILSLVINIGDKVLIAKLFSKADVTRYVIAFDINTKAYVLVAAINSAIFATMLRNHVTKRRSQRELKIGLVAVSLVALFYYLPLALFPGAIISVWVNPSLGNAAAPMVPLFAIASVIYLIGNVFEIGLLSKGMAKEIFVIYLVGVIFYGLLLIITVTSQGVLAFPLSYIAFSVAICSGFVITYLCHEKRDRNTVLLRSDL